MINQLRFFAVNKIFKRLNYFIVLFFLALVSACAPSKQSILYFQDPANSLDAFIPRAAPTPYKIRANDLLFIQVLTPDFENKQFLDTSPSKAIASDIGQNPYLSSYSVTDSGEVSLPYVGKVKVLGSTLAQAAQAIETAVRRFVRTADVSVKLASFTVSIMGEVKAPGRYPVFNGQISLFEALAMAGDLTEFANRKNVRVVREADGGSLFYTLDLTQRSLLASDKLYLMPNDLVYVEILKPRPDQASFTKAQLALGFISALAFLGNIFVIIFK